ncbi:hypothetical protein Rumeso_04967 [Rubellimicrobium mesophilum DSM 19309]|uniref:Uncharacterized protein n=1 Tax=Rubellimicrobium mesophilum DSM 19309 TaxID=442562 RepID=A0A017HB39_9RHOB|nr:hypothetical protein Rumeso_04967 [Rubellimicrobium mesophilum DSM 19309]
MRGRQSAEAIRAPAAGGPSGMSGRMIGPCAAMGVLARSASSF